MKTIFVVDVPVTSSKINMHSTKKLTDSEIAAIALVARKEGHRAVYEKFGIKRATLSYWEKQLGIRLHPCKRSARRDWAAIKSSILEK